MNINFFTTNKGKVESLRKHFINFKIAGHNIILKNHELMEPQANTVEEVSIIKAKQAYKLAAGPVLVNDSGFCMEESKGAPGPYSGYYWHQKIS